MLELISKILLSLVGPVFKYLASKAPDKALSIVVEIGPVIDQLQAQAEAEAAARKAKK